MSSPCFQGQHAILQFVPVPLESLGELPPEGRQEATLPSCPSAGRVSAEMSLGKTSGWGSGKAHLGHRPRALSPDMFLRVPA